MDVDGGLHGAFYQQVETPILGGASGRSVRASRGASDSSAHASDGSTDSFVDAEKPTDGSTHWSTRRLAKKLGIHHMMVARTWKKHGLQPHRIEHYKASNDPDFETKAADIIGLYMNPPQHAAVFCIDEKTAIQALDRRDPILPLSPGRAERHGFEYVRHGTLSLYAAFDTKTGVVLGKTVRRHTSQEFVGDAPPSDDVTVMAVR